SRMTPCTTPTNQSVSPKSDVNVTIGRTVATPIPRDRPPGVCGRTGARPLRPREAMVSGYHMPSGHGVGAGRRLSEHAAQQRPRAVDVEPIETPQVGAEVAVTRAAFDAGVER